MIEKIFLDWLKTKTTVKVATEHENDEPENLVIIEKVGSTYDDRLRTARFAVQSYGKTLYEAANLNEEMIEICLQATEVENIFNVDLNGDYNFPDIERKRYRYQAVIVITYI